MQDQDRDRLRELLDAVLDENNRTLEDMAGGAWSSPYHFSRRLTRGTGEPPVTMRRR
ncbi:MAG: AraC family transcriptional regulator, partial [Arsenicicoccus sp.]